MAAFVELAMTAIAPALMALVLVAAALLGFGLLALLIEFFKEVVFAYFLDGHVQSATRHLLDVFENNGIVQGFLVPVSVEGLHELPEVNDSVLPFLGIFFLQRFLDEFFDILAIVLEANLTLRIFDAIGFLEEDIPFRDGIRGIDIEVEIGDDVKVIPHALGIFRLILDGGCELFDQFDERIGHLRSFVFVGYIADVFHKLLNVAAIFLQDKVRPFGVVFSYLHVWVMIMIMFLLNVTVRLDDTVYGLFKGLLSKFNFLIAILQPG